MRSIAFVLSICDEIGNGRIKLTEVTTAADVLQAVLNPSRSARTIAVLPGIAMVSIFSHSGNGSIPSPAGILLQTKRTP